MDGSSPQSIDDIRAARRAPLRDMLVTLPPYAGEPEILLYDAIQAMFELGPERVPPERVQALLEAGLDRVTTAGPAASLDDMRGDAAIWAACATPRELEVYLAEIAKAFGRRPLPPVLIKRLIVDLWTRMGTADRRAFLHRCDPDGTFRAGGTR